MNAATKYVATHHPETLQWGPHQALGPNIVEDVQRLKAEGDGPNLVVWGSSTLTSTLLEHNLADELLLVVYPVLLGTGKRLFADGTPPRTFEFLATRPSPSGALLNMYKFNGAL